MKILDKTPFRTESGEIDIVGRVRGSLSHGLSWYARIQAQNVVIAILEKVLGDKYVLVRNATLVDTEIELPLVLVGPQGVFLINVVHERGVYRAKDDEWGTVRGEQFVPAAINQVKRTQKLARVLQVYLDRAGFKDMLIVDPILMSADPGTHIESTRPAVRIIMSDALERFAISINQGRAILNGEAVHGIVKTILTGPEKKAEPAAPRAASPMATAASGGKDTTDALFSGAQPQDSQSTGFSFNEEPPRPATQHQPPAYQPGPPQNTDFQNAGSQNSGYQEDRYQDRGFQDTGFQGLETGREGFREMDAPVFASEGQADTSSFDSPQTNAQPEARKKRPVAAPKKRSLFGMTTQQVTILGVGLFIWLCVMAALAAYIYFNLNA